MNRYQWSHICIKDSHFTETLPDESRQIYKCIVKIIYFLILSYKVTKYLRTKKYMFLQEFFLIISL